MQRTCSCRKLLGLPLFVVFVTACDDHQRPPPAAPTTTAEATSQSPQPTPPPVAPLAPSGCFTSDACGERTYTRDICFEPGRFRATDLVSPCPPDATCVWSGIVERSGTWEMEGTTVRLRVEEGDAGPGTPLSPNLDWTAGKLTEPGTDSCLFRGRDN